MKTARVTLDLRDYDQMRDEIEELQREVARINADLQRVCQISVEKLHQKAQELRATQGELDVRAIIGPKR